MKKIFLSLMLIASFVTTTHASPIAKPVIEGTEFHTGDGNIGLFEKSKDGEVEKTIVSADGIAISGYSDNNEAHKIINFLAPTNNKSYPLVSYEGQMNSDKTEMLVKRIYLNIPGSKSIVYNASEGSSCKIVLDQDDNNYACISAATDENKNTIVFISRLHEKNNSI